MNHLMLTSSLCHKHHVLFAYGHAMPSNLIFRPNNGILGITGIGKLRLADATFVVKGISVSISRGGPPLLEE